MATPPAPVRWRVVHPRVFIRNAPSTSAGILSVAKEGREVESFLQEGNWIRLTQAGADGRAAWMMVDGAELGLGPLLQRVAKTTRWDWRVQKDADGRFRLLPPAVPGSPTPAPPDFSARWRVVHEPRVAIRAGPSTSAAIIGALRAGNEVVSVAEQGPWIQLGAAHIPRADARTAWMMVDGSELGLGPLLVRTDRSHAQAPPEPEPEPEPDAVTAQIPRPELVAAVARTLPGKRPKLESGGVPGRQQMLLRARPAADFVAAPVAAPPQRQPQQPTRQS